MRDDGKTLAGVEIASIVLRKADTLTPVTEKDHSISLPHSRKRVFQSLKASERRSGMKKKKRKKVGNGFREHPRDQCLMAVSKYI